MARLIQMKNKIESFKREFAWELKFDRELQDELSEMYAEFFAMARAVRVC